MAEDIISNFGIIRVGDILSVVVNEKSTFNMNSVTHKLSLKFNEMERKERERIIF